MTHNHDENAINLQIIRSYDDLLKHQDDWNHIYSLANTSNPFLKFNWIAGLINHRLPERELLLILFKDQNDTPIGIAPLILSDRNKTRIKKITFIEPGWTHYYDFIIAKGYEQPFIERLMVFLFSEFKRAWHALELFPVRMTTLNFQILMQYMIQQNIQFNRKVQNISIILPIENSWETYFGNLSKNAQRNLKKSHKKLTARHEINTMFSWNFPNDQCQLEKLFDDAVAVSQRTWQANTDRGDCISKNPFQTFQREIFLKDPQNCLVSVLYGDDVPLSFYILFRNGDRAIAFQKGFDQTYKQLGIGRLHEKAVIEYIFKLGFTECDFMGIREIADVQGKLFWSTHKRDAFNLYIFNHKNIYGKALRFYKRYFKKMHHFHYDLPELGDRE